MLRIEAIRGGCVYLIGDERLVCNKRCLTKEDPEGILFITNTNVEGIFRYGYEQMKADYFGHGPGYVWHSRASVMNANFDVMLMEAYYKEEGSNTYTTCAIDMVRYEELFNEYGYELVREPRKENKSDVYYDLKKRGDN
jgi:hypothetical protein